jgi:hypothetical protein
MELFMDKLQHRHIVELHNTNNANELPNTPVANMVAGTSDEKVFTPFDVSK